MHIGLFMEDATDDFSYAVSYQTKDHSNPTYMAKWLESKPTPFKFDDNGTLAEKLEIRNEIFGSVMLNRQTGKVYEMDAQAAKAMQLFIDGVDTESVAKLLDVSTGEISKFVSLCEVEQILDAAASLAERSLVMA